MQLGEQIMCCWNVFGHEHAVGRASRVLLEYLEQQKASVVYTLARPSRPLQRFCINSTRHAWYITVLYTYNLLVRHGLDLD